MNPPRKRPWYRLHWLTWVVMVTVAGALVSRQREKEFVLAGGELGMYYERSSVGWPLQHAEAIESGAMVMTGPVGFVPGTTSTSYEWFVWPLLANCGLGILLIAATAFICESWLRQQRRLQINLRQILVAMATLGILLTLTRPWTVGYRDLNRFEMEWSLISLSDVKNPLHWPILAALACTIYAAAWLVGTLALRAWTFIRPSRA